MSMWLESWLCNQRLFYVMHYILSRILTISKHSAISERSYFLKLFILAFWLRHVWNVSAANNILPTRSVVRLRRFVWLLDTDQPPWQCDKCRRPRPSLWCRRQDKSHNCTCPVFRAWWRREHSQPPHRPILSHEWSCTSSLLNTGGPYKICLLNLRQINYKSSFFCIEKCQKTSVKVKTVKINLVLRNFFVRVDSTTNLVLRSEAWRKNSHGQRNHVEASVDPHANLFSPTFLF